MFVKILIFTVKMSRSIETILEQSAIGTQNYLQTCFYNINKPTSKIYNVLCSKKCKSNSVTIYNNNGIATNDHR